MNVRNRIIVPASVVVSLVLLTLPVPHCLASWGHVPQEIRIMRSDLVVIATITELGKTIEHNGRRYNVGVLKLTTTLHGKPKKKGEIHLAWPERFESPTDLVYRVGQKGIWVLKSDENLPIYWATYPTDYQPMEKLADLRKNLDNVKKMKWGKAKNGLQVGLVVERRDRVFNVPVQGIVQLTVYPLLKNASDKPMRVLDHSHDRPVSISFQDPDGTPIDVNLYGFGPMRDVTPKPFRFKTVSPGSFHAPQFGFPLPVCTKSGKYTIKLVYKNKRDGRPQDIDRVWRGQAGSAAIKVEVPSKSKKEQVKEQVKSKKEQVKSKKEQAQLSSDLSGLKKSANIWKKLKLKCGGNYRYSIQTFSSFGYRTKTEIVVRRNKVVGRRFSAEGQLLPVGGLPLVNPSVRLPGAPGKVPKANVQPAKPKRNWTETGDDVGKNQQGAPARTLDQLYKISNRIAAHQLKSSEKREISFDAHGVLRTCYYFDTRILDDTPKHGVIISSLKIEKKDDKRIFEEKEIRKPK